MIVSKNYLQQTNIKFHRTGHKTVKEKDTQKRGEHNPHETTLSSRTGIFKVDWYHALKVFK